MKVLSIEQMSRLKELGVDINKASMCYISKYPSCDFDDGDSIVVVSKDFNKRLYNEFGPAFTLQDIIELLQGTKSFYFRKECENFYLKIEKFSDTNYSISYENSDHFIVGFSGSCLLTCTYNMLIWVAENGYLTSK